MKYIPYTSLIEAEEKAEFILSEGKKNNIFNSQTLKFCDIKINSKGTEFYVPLNSERTRGFGYVENDYLIAIEVETWPQGIWHDDTRIIQVILTSENNFNLLKSYPEFATLIKVENVPSFFYNNSIYLYLNYLLAEHRTLLVSYNAIINERS